MNRSAKTKETNDQHGFSLVELLISMLITLIIMGAAVAVFSGALSVRERESGRTDAITAAQAALSVMSREIGNAGYGISSNGLIIDDCNASSLRFRANVLNNNNTTSDPGEDVTYFCENCVDDTDGSIVRFDRNTGVTSGIINQISRVTFDYHHYNPDGTPETPSPSGTPRPNTGRVTITLTIKLPNVQGQPTNREEQVLSDVTLRNSPYMLGQY